MAANTTSATRSHHDARELVERAKKFSVRLPLVGTVRVPPPDQLAFYGALGILAALNVIDWPVALAVGAGQAVLSRHLGERADIDAEPTKAAPASSSPRPSARRRKPPAAKAAKSTRS